MFKNYKLSECDNFLYGAYAGIAAAVTVWLHLLFQKIDISLSFMQGLNWWVTMLAFATMVISAILWTDESLKKYRSLLEEKGMASGGPGEEHRLRLEKLDTECQHVDNYGGGLIVLGIGTVFFSYYVWFTS